MPATPVALRAPSVAGDSSFSFFAPTQVVSLPALLFTDGEWRVAFAFDTKREAILLVAGDKSGSSEKRFYRRLVRKADECFAARLARSKKKGKKSWL